MPAQSRAHTAFDRYNTGIVGLNSTWSVAVGLCFFFLCYPLQTQALRWADPLSKKSYIQNYWVIGLCPSSSILKTRERKVSETGSVSVLHTRSLRS
jgi:hypothetical protein